MLEVLNKIICSSIMAAACYYVIKKLINDTTPISLKSIPNLVVFVGISVVLHPMQYQPIYTIIILLLNIVVYQKIFKITIEQSTVACCIYMVVMMASDAIATTILRQFYTQEIIRTDFIVSIMANLAIGILSTEIIDIKFILNRLRKFYETITNKRFITNALFLIILTVGFCYILFNIGNHYINGVNYIANLIIMIVFVAIAYIYIESKNSYKQLSDEYDTLFTYVQNFEDWIEKEQLNRHEYKNQLAVISSIAKDKKVKDKISGILEDNINIEGDVVHKLKELPKGGLKGLMYYKVAIAQKNKLKVEVDVSIKNKNILNNLTEDKMKIICKLIGIYFDNAIEAAVETKKKVVSLEVYDLKNSLNIVISNTFVKSDNFSKRNERGITTKGEGHGNGLYYANNLLSKNKWLDSKQEVIDNYYIQTLTIKKLD